MPMLSEKFGWKISNGVIYEYWPPTPITDINEEDLEFLSDDTLKNGITDDMLFIIPLVNVAKPHFYEGERARLIWNYVEKQDEQ